jgi:hypothetical protein
MYAWPALRTQRAVKKLSSLFLAVARLHEISPPHEVPAQTYTEAHDTRVSRVDSVRSGPSCGAAGGWNSITAGHLEPPR